MRSDPALAQRQRAGPPGHDVALSSAETPHSSTWLELLACYDAP